MARQFLPEITYMRGLCMLGVIGIHVGSIALSNPAVNTQLVCVLEILSRFTVPAFFFLSAFGLFYHTPTDAPFSYKDFLKRRIQVVLWPYIAWSLLYTVYSAIIGAGWHALSPRYFLAALAFGNAEYHLYFMVILLWFYLMMPLWRKWVKVILKAPIAWLVVIFLVQTAVNFWSSYFAGRITWDQPAIQYAYSMRLNYWVIHYVWIFLLGAVAAERYDSLVEGLWRFRLALTAVFFVSATLMVAGYYYVMIEWHYTVLEAIYTVHQLSPMGMLYTGAATLFFLFSFIVSPMGGGVQAFWQQIGEKSYGIYLVHPFMLVILTALLTKVGRTYTVPTVIGLYICAVGLSYLATLVMDKFPKPLRRILLGH